MRWMMNHWMEWMEGIQNHNQDDVNGVCLAEDFVTS